MICIYKITSPSNKIYIGQTTNYSKRHNAYKNHKCKGQPKLFASIEKYGFINHTIEIVKECQVEDLNYYERYYQEYYESVLDGLNLRYTATTDKSGFMSEETKKKMSDSGKGKIITEEWRKNLSIAGMNRRHTEEEKQKISQANKGKIKTPEHIAKIQATLKTMQMPKRSEETKALQSLNNGKSKKVNQYDLQGNFINQFRSGSQASRELGISVMSISSCALGKLKTGGGFVWKYENC
jgi:group I intron endonuclease